ncbi:MAG: hypothetical protein ACTSRG_20270 [Candidatus Helarchaeota archaeon]
MPDLLDMLDDLEDKTEEEVKIKDLHPPKTKELTKEEFALAQMGKGNDFLKSPPKQSENEKLLEQIKKMKAISGYWKWVTSSETQRFYYFTRMEKTHRGSEEKLITDLKVKHQEIEDVKEFKRIGINSAMLREMKESNKLFQKQKLKNNK